MNLLRAFRRGPQATIRASNEAGQRFDDPSPERLAALLDGFRTGNEFLVVERLDAGSKQVYAQVAVHPDGGYWVEYRDGGPDRHFQAHVEDRSVVLAVLTAYAAGDDAWRTALPWQRLEF